MKSRIYKCPDSINNLKFRVHITKIHSPQIELELNSTEDVTQIFTWQQKIFSQFELDYYSDENNCYTDLDKQYHTILSKASPDSSVLFSYINDDVFAKTEEKVTTDLSPNLTKLHQAILNSNQKFSSNHSSEDNYNFEKSLTQNLHNPHPKINYESMYIMADLGETNENTLFKSEFVLCCIKYDQVNKVLWMYPDFSGKSSPPYRLEIGVDGKVIYEYTIENISPEKSPELVEKHSKIIEKILKENNKIKSQMLGTSFLSPEKNTQRIFLILEIQTARNFEYTNIYVQYNIDLPEYWTCADETTLYGTTQTCKVKGHDNTANFGFLTEITLDFQTPEDFKGFPEYPCIYFQVISHDHWNTFRSEGYSYKCIPIIQSGIHNFELQCLRICPKTVFGNLRRFFIGDFNNIDDVTWIGIPKYHEGNTLNKYGVTTIGTGTLNLRLNLINQSKITNRFKIGDLDEKTPENIASISLVKSISDVLLAFKRAREKMLTARKNVLNNID